MRAYTLRFQSKIHAYSCHSRAKQTTVAPSFRVHLVVPNFLQFMPSSWRLSRYCADITDNFAKINATLSSNDIYYIFAAFAKAKKSVDDDLNSTTRNGHADYVWKYEATFVTRNTRQERGRNAAHVRPLASRKIAHVNRQLFSASTSTAAVSCISRPFNWAVQSPAFKTPA